MDTARWIAGEEYDEEVLERLSATLLGLGYALGDAWSALAGSQDVRHWEVHGSGGCLTIESETYVGVSISGPTALVEDVRASFLSGISR